MWESNRNRAPVVLIASQITRDELGFEFPQEVDFRAVYGAGTVFCEEIRTAAQARRMTAIAAQAALSRKGVAVLIVPVDVSRAHAPDEPDFLVHRAAPVIRPSDAELDRRDRHGDRWRRGANPYRVRRAKFRATLAIMRSVSLVMMTILETSSFHCCYL